MNCYASDEISEQAKDELDDYGQYLSSLAPGQVGAALEQLAGSQNANLGTATQNALKQLNASLLSAVRQLDMDTRETGRVWLQGLDSGGRLDAQHGSAGLSRKHPRRAARRRLVNRPRVANRCGGRQVRQRLEHQGFQG